MTKHMMVDCETLGLAPGCAILQIGAVVWDDQADAADLGYRWGRHVDLLDCLMRGLRVEDNTLDWWRSPEQEEARRSLVLRGGGDAVPLTDALQQLRGLWQETGAERLWANGPAADAVWLEAAYRAVGLVPPWRYSQVRCFRTLMELAGVESDDRTAPDLPHDGLSDAAAQVTDARRALDKLRAGREAARTRRIHVELTTDTTGVQEIVDSAAALAVRQQEDDARWQFLEEEARRSTTGISFDRVPGGYRFMRRHVIGERAASLRAAVDLVKNERSQLERAHALEKGEHGAAAPEVSE